MTHASRIVDALYPPPAAEGDGEEVEAAEAAAQAQRRTDTAALLGEITFKLLTAQQQQVSVRSHPFIEPRSRRALSSRRESLGSRCLTELAHLESFSELLVGRCVGERTCVWSGSGAAERTLTNTSHAHATPLACCGRGPQCASGKRVRERVLSCADTDVTALTSYLLSCIRAICPPAL